jgi:hypothetical protein
MMFRERMFTDASLAVGETFTTDDVGFRCAKDAPG